MLGGTSHQGLTITPVTVAENTGVGVITLGPPTTIEIYSAENFTARVFMPAGSPPGAATAVACQMVGALQMARALGHTAEGRALLAENRAVLLAQYDTPEPD